MRNRPVTRSDHSIHRHDPTEPSARGTELGSTCTIGPVRLPRLSPRAYQRITLAALVALVGIIITGAAVRLTGSGLGCSDWPTCENDRVVAPLEYHAMVEFVNRSITGFVSVLVILAVLGALVRTPRRRDLTWLSLGLVAGVIGQIVLGGLTVLFELRPPFVIAHFVLSLVLVWNALVLYRRAGTDGSRPLPVVAPRIRAFARGLVVIACSVVLTGTITTGTGPHGGDETVERFSFDLETVARIHSLCAWALLALTIVTLAAVHRRGAPLDVVRAARGLVVVIVVQGAIGYIQYFAGVPPWLVLLHIVGSVAVFIAVLWFDLSLVARPSEVEQRPTIAAQT